jgi:hypothetical protein
MRVIQVIGTIGLLASFVSSVILFGMAMGAW